MTKSQYQSLMPGKHVSVRYQYMGRKQEQVGWRAMLRKDSVFIYGIGHVSYKSVDLVK